jgi:hypothetical protein
MQYLKRCESTNPRLGRFDNEEEDCTLKALDNVERDLRLVLRPSKLFSPLKMVQEPSTNGAVVIPDIQDDHYHIIKSHN